MLKKNNIIRFNDSGQYLQGQIISFYDSEKDKFEDTYDPCKHYHILINMKGFYQENDIIIPIKKIVEQDTEKVVRLAFSHSEIRDIFNLFPLNDKKYNPIRNKFAMHI